MADIESTSNRLEVLRRQSAFSASDRSEIEILYTLVLGKTFIRTSCSDCYHDAVIEMYLYLKKYGKMKEKSTYTLKNGAVIQLGFGSSKMFTNSNLTDEAAEKFLANNPKGLVFFASYPDDWEERVEKRKKADKAKKQE